MGACPHQTVGPTISMAETMQQSETEEVSTNTGISTKNHSNPSSKQQKVPKEKQMRSYRIRRWTGFNPSRTSGRARPSNTDIAYAMYASVASLWSSVGTILPSPAFSSFTNKLPFPLSSPPRPSSLSSSLLFAFRALAGCVLRETPERKRSWQKTGLGLKEMTGKGSRC